jgi:AcrR family transcriptional regulator
MRGMGRRAQPEIRVEILDACADLALRDGLPDRLEPFADATGVSTRMLLYHFGSRDELLRAVLQRARARQLALFTDLLRPRPERPYPEVLERAWLAMRGPDGEPYLRVFGRLRQDAEQRLWPGFARLATTDWLGPLEEGLSTLGRPELATLVLAVIRGLLMDLEATGDVDRVDSAFRELIDAIASGR